MSINEPTTPRTAMRSVWDLLVPVMGDISRKTDTVIDLLKQLIVLNGGEVPGIPPAEGGLKALVARAPLSPRDLALSYLASDETGMVTPRPQKFVQNVPALVGTWQQIYQVPVNTVGILLGPVSVLATVHGNDVLASLQVDGRLLFLDNHPLQEDVSLDFMEYIVVKQNITLNIDNNNALASIITFEIPVAEVPEDLWNTVWKPILYNIYQTLKGLAG